MANPTFLGSMGRDILPGAPALLGCPMDRTSTFRHGSQEAPRAIREASESIETYSPLFDKDLTDNPFADVGDLELQSLPVPEALAAIRAEVTRILQAGGKPFWFGGEHLVTLPGVQALHKKYPDLKVIHLDAHTDLREDYEGEPLNHATVIKRVAELIGPGSLTQLGIRSGTREEFQWMRDNGTLLTWIDGAEKQLLKRIGDAPVHITLDLDVLDPALMPPTGNPEAGGWFYHDIERFFRACRPMNIVSADVVELNPSLDYSGVGAATAAKITRELILLLQRE